MTLLYVKPRYFSVLFISLLSAGCLFVPSGSSTSGSAPPASNPIAAPVELSSCTSGQPYDVTLQARNQFRWPFANGCSGASDFYPWFETQRQNKWLGRNIYFDGLDKKALSQVHLQHETLSVDAIVFDRDHDDFQHAEVSLNGYRGSALNTGAVTYQVLQDITFSQTVNMWNDETVEKDSDLPPLVRLSSPSFNFFGNYFFHFLWQTSFDWNGYQNGILSNWNQWHPYGLQVFNDDLDHDNIERNDNDDPRTPAETAWQDAHDFFDDKRDDDRHWRHHRIHINHIRLVRISFHLEDYNFGVNHSAADLIRQSASTNGTLDFKLKHIYGRLVRNYRATNGTLELQGNYPGVCPTPTPSPTASPTATPRSSPSPTPIPVATITSTSVGSLTNSTSVSISFSANVTATFQCSFNTGPYSACTSPFTQSDLANGPQYFAVEAITPTGAASVPAQFDWTVDTTPPVVTFGTINPAGTYINQNQITINFSANESATFQCSVDSRTATNCSSPVSLSDLTDGPHSFGVVATDLAGNVSSMATYTWTVETTPPTVAFTLIVPSNSPSNSTVRTFSFIGSSDTVSYICSLDSATAAACTSPYPVTGLSEGAHQFDVYAIDAAGNVSTPAVSQFTIDTTPPVVLITSTVPPQNPTNNTSMQISFSATESSTFTCALDSAPMGPCTSPMSYAGLGQGTHQFQVSATDTAGNVSTTAATYSWTIDTIAPVVTFVSANPSASVTNSTQMVLTFSVNDTESTTAACSLDGAASSNCSADSISYASLSDGTHSISVVATDAAGNVSNPFNYSWTVDTNNPAVQITSENPGTAVIAVNSITFTFSATDIEPLTYSCSLDGARAATCTSPITYSNLTQGTHEFSVTATNAVGGTSVSPATYNFSVDLNPPVTSITSETPSVSPTMSTTITFNFTADKPSTFTCALDANGAVPCTSPLNYNNLADGNHTFVVVATDVVGNVDPNGASYSWTVNTQPLTISNFLVSNVTTTSATISWDTNFPADSQVFYALNPPTTYTASTYYPTLTLTHSVTLTGLQPFANYSVYPESNAGDQSATSPIVTFSTLR